MAQFSYGPDGEEIVHARFTRSGVLTMNYIFPNDRHTTAKLAVPKKGRKGTVLEAHGVTTYSKLVRQIFYHCITDILERVAAGEVFMLPGTTGANISLQKIPDREVRMLRQLGRYEDYDIVRANFIIPRFVFDFGANFTRKNRNIYVGKRIEAIAHENVMNNAIPWITIRKRLNYDNRIKRPPT